MDSDPGTSSGPSRSRCHHGNLLAVAISAAFITTLEDIDTRHASDVTHPGTIGLAKPHPPLDRAPGEPIRN
jgi:hypothetical protein